MNEERRPKVPPKRTNAYPRPSPTASRKTARAYLAISPALAARSCTPSILVVPCGRNHAATDHGSVVVEGRDLPCSDTVGRLLELEGDFVHDRAVAGVEPVALEEGSVVVAGQEARLLALAALRDGETRRPGLAARLRLRLFAEREFDPVQKRRVERREHVRLVLVRVGCAGEQPAAATV